MKTDNLNDELDQDLWKETLENLPESLDDLPSMPLSQRSKLPDSTGLYFVFSRGVLLYIGKASNLKTRWCGSSHHRYTQVQRLDNPIISYFVCNDIDRLELIAIERFNPLLNNTGEDNSSEVKTIKEEHEKLKERYLTQCGDIQTLVNLVHNLINHKAIIANELKQIAKYNAQLKGLAEGFIEGSKNTLGSHIEGFLKTCVMLSDVCESHNRLARVSEEENNKSITPILKKLIKSL